MAKKILIGISSFLLALVSIVPASGAAISLTFPTSATNFDANTWQSVATQTSVTPVITGGNGGTFRVAVDATNSGLLRLGVTTNITASTGYSLTNFNSTSNGLSAISFEGAVADVSNALASLQFKKTAVGASTISVSAVEGTGLIYNNHYYEVYTASLDWQTALKTSLTKSIPASDGGLACQGYLATITSAEEQAFAYDKVRTTSWIALSDKASFVNAAITAYNVSFDPNLNTYADDAAVEGKFHWVVGPERGIQVTTGNYTGGSTPLVEGAYANWNGSEPNDSSSNEDATQMLANGLWNDLPHTTSTVATYIVEYGGLRVTGNQATNPANVDVTNADHIGTRESCTPAAVSSGVSASFTANTVSVPDAPTSVSGSSTAGSLQASISWTAPVNTGGTAITGYKIETSTDNGSTWTTAIANTSSAATSATLTGLSVMSYRFRVSAINAAGTSSPSTASSAVTITASVPGLPTNLIISHNGTGAATVSWDAPATNGGSSITGYTVQYQVGSSWIDLSNSDRQATVSNVFSTQTWSFRVAAINAIGTGSFATKTHEPPPPYSGPIITNLAKYSVSSSGQRVTVRGINLDLVTAALVDGQAVTIISKSGEEMVISLPALTTGIKDLRLTYGSGTATHQDAFVVVEAEPAEAAEAENAMTEKVNAGSFKGFVALYAKGYAGHRFTAKVGNDWVIVEKLGSDYERIVEFTGSGYEINLRIFIDRELVMTKQFVTK